MKIGLLKSNFNTNQPFKHNHLKPRLWRQNWSITNNRLNLINIWKRDAEYELNDLSWMMTLLNHQFIFQWKRRIYLTACGVLRDGEKLQVLAAKLASNLVEMFTHHLLTTSSPLSLIHTWFIQIKIQLRNDSDNKAALNDSIKHNCNTELFASVSVIAAFQCWHLANMDATHNIRWLASAQ